MISPKISEVGGVGPMAWHEVWIPKSEIEGLGGGKGVVSKKVIPSLAMDFLYHDPLADNLGGCMRKDLLVHLNSTKNALS